MAGKLKHIEMIQQRNEFENSSTYAAYVFQSFESQPHMVSLNFRYHICGGSLVNELWVVTSASCFFGIGAVEQSHDIDNSKLGLRRRLEIRLGEHNIKMKEGTEQL